MEDFTPTKEGCNIEEGKDDNFYILAKNANPSVFLYHDTNTFEELRGQDMTDNTFCEGLDFHSKEEAQEFLDNHFNPTPPLILYTSTKGDTT